HKMIYTGVTEVFLTYIKVSLFSAAFISFPLIVIQIWRFIAPGLYFEEKKIFFPLLIATPVLFLLGAAFAYFFVFPLAYEFFLSFEIPGSTGTLPIQLEARVSEYLSFVMRLIFAFGICFELPVILMILASIGVVTSTKLKKQWRFAIIGIFILAAFITPPDILSMIALALPLIFLYGLSILMVRVIENRQAQ
ncbi:MAG: twin-arginine translocase subunit TatC, partial [Proteobacteria bacterium]|nr:twin-arginine translocase subunit TatC [Pseudomonadota bacterium]